MKISWMNSTFVALWDLGQRHYSILQSLIILLSRSPADNYKSHEQEALRLEQTDSKF